jgi:hypothetical protein
MTKAYNPLPLRPAQQTVFSDRRWFRAAIVGRRWGKTHLACAELRRGAKSKVGHYLYLAPNYSMAKDIGWEAMRAAIPDELIEETLHSTLSLKLKNGSTIQMGSVQVPFYWKGTALCGVVLDEFAQYDFDVWSSIVKSCVADLQGWALFLTTGMEGGSLGPCYEHMSYDLQPIYRYTSLQGGNTSEERVEEARKTLSRQAFRVEFEAAMM